MKTECGSYRSLFERIFKFIRLQNDLSGKNIRYDGIPRLGVDIRKGPIKLSCSAPFVRTVCVVAAISREAADNCCLHGTTGTHKPCSI